MTTSTFTELTYEEQANVGIITLQRPEARNALTRRTYRELEEAVRTTEARCLVVTGADPAFCAGDDVKLLMVPAGEAVAGTDPDPRDGASDGAGVLALTPAAEALLTPDR